MNIKQIMDITGLSREIIKHEISEIWPLLIQKGKPTKLESTHDVYLLFMNMKKRDII